VVGEGVIGEGVVGERLMGEGYPAGARIPSR
jgi:hypothetical protein